jgi:hypothetical protein
MLPETKYAKSGDNHIAYQITGSSPVDVVLAQCPVSGVCLPLLIR